MKRGHMPLAVKLEAALRALGLDPDAVEWDHDPALAMRPIDPETGDTIPPANSARHIVPRARADHKLKTFGSAAPLSGDVSRIAKMRRLEKQTEAARERILAKGVVAKSVERARWGERKIQSRPFPKARRK